MSKQHIDFGDEETTIVAMEISPSYKHIALLSKQGKLWIGSTDLRRNYRIYDTRNQIPKQIAWYIYNIYLDNMFILYRKILYNYVSYQF